MHWKPKQMLLLQGRAPVTVVEGVTIHSEISLSTRYIEKR